jgi:HTH-type transcriptional regulator, competence development regulator
MTTSFGTVLRRAREVRKLSGSEAARSAGISAAYLSKLENDAVKHPSPQVLYQLSNALAVPYADLMRLTGYLVPGESTTSPTEAITASLFSDLTDDERTELLEYLAWYRARHAAGRRATGRTPGP